jgi:O-6-methylguanine DNA methyltransferase
MSEAELFSISSGTRMGRFEIVSSSVGLRGVYWPGEKAVVDIRLLAVAKAPAAIAKLLKTTTKQLADYFDGQNVRFTTRLDLSGLTPFAQKVSKAARAVGNILANNPLPIIVPCHRVLSSNGSLGGFSAPGGLKLKRQLLLMEKNSV